MARRKSRFGIVPYLLLGFALWLGLKYFQTEPDAPVSPAPEAAIEPASGTALTERDGPAYALKPLANDWPPLAGESAVPVAPASSATVNYYVVLDGSGSMLREDCSGGVPKIDAALSALREFVAAVPPEANLGLAVFDDAGLTERVTLASGNRPAFLRALDQVRASGGTPLRSSIELGYQQLLTQGQRQLGYGEYHLVVVTDGHPDPDSEDPAETVDALLSSTPVVLHTIGFCIGNDHVLNQPGRSFYVAADSPDQLQAGLTSVLAESPSFDVSQFPGP